MSVLTYLVHRPLVAAGIFVGIIAVMLLVNLALVLWAPELFAKPMSTMPAILTMPAMSQVSQVPQVPQVSQVSQT